MGEQWLSEVRQQIQVLDMELQAGIRIFAKRIEPDHVVAFMAALARRDKLMANVVSYLVQNQVFERKLPAQHEAPAPTPVKQHENKAAPHEEDNWAAVNTKNVIKFPGQAKNTR